MTDPSASASAPAPPELNVRTPAVCVQCGYSLVGLPRDGACPECETSIARSLRPMLLREKPIEFITRTRAGLKWLIAAVLLFIVTSITVPTLGMLSSSKLIAGSLIEWVMLPFLGLVMFVSWIAWIGGWWQLSTPDNSLARPRTRIAMALRFFCWVQIGSIPFAVIAVAFAAGNRRYDLPAGVAYATALIACLVCLPVGAYRLRQLASLIPDVNVEVKITTLYTLYRVILVCVGVTVSSIPLGAIVPVLGVAVFCLSTIGWFGIAFAFPICLASFRGAVDEELRQHVPQHP